MCGVVGVLSRSRDVFDDAVNGLFQMQHRGQDACGLAISNGRTIAHHKGMGYVRSVFPERLPDLSGFAAIGHVRYPTQGANRASSAQPHVVTNARGEMIALAANGDVTNYWEVRAELGRCGVTFDGTNDGELQVRFLAYETGVKGRTLLEAIREMQHRVRGAYSACVLTRDRLFLVRDAYGFRPLSWGSQDDFWMAASETPALELNRVGRHREVEPGEIVELTPDGPLHHPHPSVVSERGGRELPAHCVFEHVYFSRPDSRAFGMGVYEARKRMGAWLARTGPVDADVVVPVPDSSNGVALGYAQQSGIPFEFGLVRNHYIGRTFISPTQERREFGVRFKFSPQRDVLEGKRVVLVDDSIVRGTTLRKIVRMVRAAGASQVHVRIGSPITRHSCYYGVDTPDPADLIGNRMNNDEICDHLTADSLLYMTIAGLKECVNDRGQFCMACFDGVYPEPITERKRTGLA